MRIAIVSDIHGNRTAFEAVLADLHEVSPDLVLHGGDLADGGSSPPEVVDRIRDLGWAGVIGNGEEALARPETLEEFARQSKAPAALWTAVRETMAAGRAALGDERLAWLGSLPGSHVEGDSLSSTQRRTTRGALRGRTRSKPYMERPAGRLSCTGTCTRRSSARLAA